MILKILDQDFPIEYTVSVQKKIAERFGGIDKAGMEKMFSGKIVEDNSNIAFLASAMIEAGIGRQKLLCEFSGIDYEGPHRGLTEEELISILHPSMINGVLTNLLEAMNEGNKTDIEAKEEKKRKTIK